MANYSEKEGATGKKYTVYSDRIKVTYRDGSTRTVRPTDVSYQATKDAMEKDIADKKWYKPGKSTTTAMNALGAGKTDGLVSAVGKPTVDTALKNEQAILDRTKSMANLESKVQFNNNVARANNAMAVAQQQIQNPVQPMTFAEKQRQASMQNLEHMVGRNQLLNDGGAKTPLLKAVTPQTTMNRVMGVIPEQLNNQPVSNMDVAKHTLESIVQGVKNSAIQTGQAIGQYSFQDADAYRMARTGNPALVNALSNPQQTDALAEGFVQDRIETAQQYAEKMQEINEKYNADNFNTAQQAVNQIGTAVGQIAPAMLLGPAYLLPYMYGMSANQALGEGATIEQADDFAVLNTAKEFLIEMLVGGVPVGKMKSFIEPEKLMAKFNIDFGTANKVASRLFKALGEGGEEVLAGMAEPYLQRHTYDPDAESATLEELAWQFLIGAGAGGVFQGIDVANSRLRNRNQRETQQIIQNAMQNVQNQQNLQAENAESIQKPQNASESPVVADVIKNITAPNKVAENQSSQADISQNVVENVLKQNQVEKQGEQQTISEKSSTVGEKTQLPKELQDILDRATSRTSRLGMNINAVDSLTTPIGQQAPAATDSTGNIYLNANKMKDTSFIDNQGKITNRTARQILQNNLGHEIGHNLPEEAQRDIQDLAVALNEIMNPGEGRDGYFARKKQEYNDAGVFYDNDNLYWSEISSEAIGRMMEDDMLAKRAMRENPTAFQRILDAIENLIRKFKNRKLSADEKETLRILEDVQKRFSQGLNELEFESMPKQVSQLSDDPMDNEVVYDNNGNMVAEKANGTLLFNYYTGKEAMEAQNQYIDTRLRRGTLSKGDAEVFKKDMEELMSVADEMLNEENAGRWEHFVKWSETRPAVDEYGDLVLSTIVPNGDYEMNLGLSTTCVRREPMNRLIKYLATQTDFDPATLTPKEMEMCYAQLVKEGLTMPCRGCYVEAGRDSLTKMARTVETEDKAFRQAIRFDEEGNVDRNALLKAGEGLKSVTGLPEATRNRYINYYAENPNSKPFRGADILYGEGTTRLRIGDPKFAAIALRRSGQGSGKYIQEAIPYSPGEIISADWSQDRAFSVGGVRDNSFDDFQMYQWFDKWQMLHELAMKLLPAHGYTKVPEEVRLFGMTGKKYNMSFNPDVEVTLEEKRYLATLPKSNREKDPVFLRIKENAGLDKDGNFIFARESFPYEEAMQIANDDRYTDYCGTSLMGVSRKQIWKAFKDNRIDMMTPYHSSGAAADTKLDKNIAFYLDHTFHQNETYPKEGFERKPGETDAEYYSRIGETSQYGTKPDKEHAYHFDFYGSLDRTNDITATLKEYIEDCKKHGLIPKYPEYIYETITDKDGNVVDRVFNEAYYKVLTDFKLKNKNGKLCLQEAVKVGKDRRPDNWREIVEKGLEKAEELEVEMNVKIPQIADNVIKAIEGSRKESGLMFNIGYDSNGRELTPEQAEYFKDSKVRDAEGDLKVMYHGTQYGGFATFRSSEHSGFFFTDNPDVADGYTMKTGNNINPAKKMTAEEMTEYINDFPTRVEFEDGVYKVVEMGVSFDDNGDFAFEDDEYVSFESSDYYKFVEHLRKEYHKGYDQGRYETYLNIANPLIVDAKGAEHYELPALDDKSSWRTSDYVDYAKENGYDGVIFNNIVDTGFHANYRKMHTNDVSTVAVAFSPEQIKDVYNTNPTSDADIRYNLDYDEMVDEYGAMPKGENPFGDNRNIDVPRQTSESEETRGFIGTAMEAEQVADETVDVIKNRMTSDYQDGSLQYEPVSNKETLAKANERIDSHKEDGWQIEAGYFSDAVAKGTRITAEDIAVAERCIQEAQKEGNYEAAASIISDLAIVGTEYGQAIQALSMLKRLSPEGQLKTLMKVQERINNQLMAQNKKPVMNITPEVQAEFLQARGKAKRDEIWNREIAKAAQQTEGSWTDKLNALRYAAMLSNPRTHIRNLVGNFVMQAAYVPRNIISGALQDVRGGEQTHSLRGMFTNTTGNTNAELRNFANHDFHQNAKATLQNIGNRYDDVSGMFESQRKVFGNSVPGRVLEELAGSGKYSVGSMLDKEDMLFKQFTYQNALIDYMKANGLSVQDAVKGITKNGANIAKGRIYAIEQARKATFTEDNMVAEWLSKGERKFGLPGAIVIGGAMPFKKTPMNILSRGIEFSPAGLTMTAYKLFHAVKGTKGRNGSYYDMNDVMDSLGANITGSMILAAGMYLASQGLLRATDDDDNQRKNSYDYYMGDQNFAVVNPETGESWTIDWLAPAAMPLLTGVEVYRQLFGEGKEVEGGVLAKALESASKIADPVFEMSCMQGVASALASYSGDTGDIASSVMSNVVTGIGGQFVPQPLSAMARVIDDTVRSSYASKESPIGKGTESFLRQQVSKIPGASMTNEPSLNAWGEERKREFAGDGAGDVAMRVVNSFINPSTYSSNKRTELDYQLEELYRLTGNVNVLPKNATNYVEIGGKTYHKTPQEKTAYDRTRGQLSKQYVSDFVNSNAYTAMDNESKAKIVTELYDFANYQAKKDMLQKRGVWQDSFENSSFEAILTTGIAPAKFYETKFKLDTFKGDTKQDMYKSYLRGEVQNGNMTDEDAWFWWTENYTAKKYMEKCPYDWIKKLNG